MTGDEQSAADILATAQIISIAVGVAAFAAFGFVLFRAGRLPHPAPIVISLSMLTGAALLLASVSESPEAFLTIAGTGFGALAGTLTAIFAPNDPSVPKKRVPPPEQPSAPPATGETQDGAEES